MPHLSEMKPMLLDERPFDLHAPGWAYEIKFDGYRLLAEFGQVKRKGAIPAQRFERKPSP